MTECINIGNILHSLCFCSRFINFDVLCYVTWLTAEFCILQFSTNVRSCLVCSLSYVSKF
jgi:hypothetical protein